MTNSSGGETTLAGMSIYDENGVLIPIPNQLRATDASGGVTTPPANHHASTAFWFTKIEFATEVDTEIFDVALYGANDQTANNFQLVEVGTDQVEHNILQCLVNLSGSVQTDVKVRVSKHIKLPAEIDKTRLSKVKSSLIAGNHVAMLDVFALVFGKTLIAHTLINKLIDGLGYAELVASGVSKSSAIKALAIYNMIVDADRVKTDELIKQITTQFDVLAAFNVYLQEHGVARINPNQFNRLYNDDQVAVMLLPFLDSQANTGA